MSLDVDTVRQAAAGRWPWLAGQFHPALGEQLRLSLTHTTPKHVQCPFHGGKGDFRAFKNHHATGGAVCTCGSWPDGFALLMHGCQWTFPQVLHAVAAAMHLRGNGGTPPPPPVQPQARARQESSSNAEWRIRFIASIQAREQSGREGGTL